MVRINANEISEHDQLVTMMAKYFKQLGYTNIKADIPGWPKPDYIYWTNQPNNRFYPDLTCNDNDRREIILEAETCQTLNDQHTKEQFEIFRAHANKVGGRFEVVVPRMCAGRDTTQLIREIASRWRINLDNVWIPST